jgi:hypothetical protein
MSDEGSCVTLIFYRINPKWWKEPALNLASAVCQMSNLTHCEISIGEVEGGANSNTQTLKLADRHSWGCWGGTIACAPPPHCPLPTAHCPLPKLRGCPALRRAPAAMAPP